MNPHTLNSRSARMVTAFGSRDRLQQETTPQWSFGRTLSKRARDAVFRTLHLRRWAFDTEVVLLCDQLGMHLLKVGVPGVPWREVDGSKLSTSKLALAIVSITMLRVRTCYTPWAFGELNPRESFGHRRTFDHGGWSVQLLLHTKTYVSKSNRIQVQ